MAEQPNLMSNERQNSNSSHETWHNAKLAKRTQTSMPVLQETSLVLRDKSKSES